MATRWCIPATRRATNFSRSFRGNRRRSWVNSASRSSINILDKIDAGYAPGRLYSGAPPAIKRSAWQVILEFTSVVDDKKAIIRQ